MSRLLGSGHAPARGFGGGSALVMTPTPLPARAPENDGAYAGPRLCLSELPGSGGVRCRRERGHALTHVGGGWEWSDDGRCDRLPRKGGMLSAPAVFAPCVRGGAHRWDCRCAGCDARWTWGLALVRERHEEAKRGLR